LLVFFMPSTYPAANQVRIRNRAKNQLHEQTAGLKEDDVNMQLHLLLLYH